MSTIPTNNYGTTGYLVQDNINDVVAQDHNSLVADVRNLGQLWGPLGYGNGQDGRFRLGSITNPVATNVPVASDSGLSGRLSGTFYYKYAVYNFSGETTITNASTTVTVTNKQVLVQIPAQASDTNVTGYRLFRSTDNVTYYAVADIPVANATQLVSIYDNNPITSGAAPAGSNTTSNTATVGGIYRVSSIEVAAGQTINGDPNKKMGLILLCAGDAVVRGTISVNEVGTSNIYAFASSSSASVSQGGLFASGTTAGTSIQMNINVNRQALIPSSQLVFSAGLPVYLSGGGGTYMDASNSPANFGGGLLFMAVKGVMDIQSATITSRGRDALTVANFGGCAGGGIYLCANIILRAGATIAATGGNGNNTIQHASGGGGIIGFCANMISGSATVSVNGGTPGSGANASGWGGSGGFGGAGSGTNNGAGAVGVITERDFNNAILPRF